MEIPWTGFFAPQKAAEWKVSMKKLSFKGEKGKPVYAPHIFAGKTAAFLTFILLAGIAMPAYGEERITPKSTSQTVVTNIYHRHIGSPASLGGCYNIETGHTHLGDSVNGGGCYQRPVPHVHTGEENGGGGCYTLPVYHKHKGDEADGGECYQEIEHQHTDECFQSGRCTRTFVKGEEIRIYDAECFAHTVSPHVEAYCMVYHSECDLGVQNTVMDYCQLCGFMPQASHQYQKKICNKDTDYIRSCGKEEDVDIDRYETACGFGPGDVESYAPSCNITTDGYELGCGMKEDEPWGRVILSFEVAEEGAKAVIHVRVEDLSEGGLVMEDTPYIWQDQNGNGIGAGESLVVEENGRYFVTVKLKNKDVDEAGLYSSILVEGILKQKPTAIPSKTPEEAPSSSPLERPSSGPESSADPSGTPSFEPGTEATASPLEKPSSGPETGTDSSPSARPSSAPLATPSSTPKISPTPDGAEGGASQATPQATPESSKEPTAGDTVSDSGEGKEIPQKTPGVNNNKKEEGNPGERGMEQNDSSSKKDSRQDTDNSHWTNKTPNGEKETAVGPGKIIQKENRKVAAKENQSYNGPAQKGKLEKEIGIEGMIGRLLRLPAVKIITITTGMLLLVAGGFFLLAYLRRSIKVYNDDGEGKLIYLGRCMVRFKEEGDVMILTEEMVEKSYTNRYCLKPGLFMSGRKKGEELIIYRGSKKQAVPFGKEMIVVI